MSVPFSSYEAGVMSNAIGMVAASATFRSLTGSADATAARAWIIESDGGAPEEDAIDEGDAIATDGTSFAMSSPHAIVHIASLDSRDVGIGVFDHSGIVEVILKMPRTLSGETPPESTRRARNTLGGIRADLEAMLGGSGAFATAFITTEGPFLPNNTGANADAVLGILRIDFSA